MGGHGDWAGGKGWAMAGDSGGERVEQADHVRAGGPHSSGWTALSGRTTFGRVWRPVKSGCRAAFILYIYIYHVN